MPQSIAGRISCDGNINSSNHKVRFFYYVSVIVLGS